MVTYLLHFQLHQIDKKTVTDLSFLLEKYIGSRARLVKILRSGFSFGEMSIMSSKKGSARNASIICVENTHLLYCFFVRKS